MANWVVDVQWRLLASGYVEVEADSREEAIAKARDYVQTPEGLEDLATQAFESIRDSGSIATIDEFWDTATFGPAEEEEE